MEWGLVIFRELESNASQGGMLVVLSCVLIIGQGVWLDLPMKKLQKIYFFSSALASFAVVESVVAPSEVLSVLEVDCSPARFS